jgi:hypothetical protein
VKPETRRSLVTMLIGIMAALLGLLATTWLREDACLDAGGRWLATRTCELPPGAEMPSSLRFYFIGVVVGLVTALLLWRTYTFITTRARVARPGPNGA